MPIMTQNEPRKEELSAIAETIEGRRRKTEFLRGGVFLTAGWISLATLSVQFTLDRLWPANGEVVGYLLWVVASMVGCTLFLCYRDRHRTLTLTDRQLLNVWGASVCISGSSAVYALPVGLPVAGFLTLGMSIAAAFTAELFRKEGSNKSNQGGSLVVLQGVALCGAWLSAWTFRAAHDGQTIMQFVLTLVAVLLLLFGTGLVLRHNEHRCV